MAGISTEKLGLAQDESVRQSSKFFCFQFQLATVLVLIKEISI